MYILSIAYDIMSNERKSNQRKDRTKKMNAASRESCLQCLGFGESLPINIRKIVVSVFPQKIQLSPLHILYRAISSIVPHRTLSSVFRVGRHCFGFLVFNIGKTGERPNFLTVEPENVGNCTTCESQECEKTACPLVTESMIHLLRKKNRSCSPH